MTTAIETGPAAERGLSPLTARYLHPLDLVPAATAAAAIAGGQALPLAGGPLAFRALEVIEREATAVRRRRRYAVDDLPAAVSPAALARLTASRPPIAGLDFSRPRLMGVVNVTPDSFSDGGRNADTAKAIAHACALAAAGADILDVGGESTRPGARPIAPAVELARVLPVVSGLVGAGLPVSVDTRHGDVMRAVLAAGAAMINDVTALSHEAACLDVVAAAGVPAVLMHAQGTPDIMQAAPHYDDVLLDVYDYLDRRILACEAAGIPRSRLLVDPGIGFGKTLEHNLSLLRGLALFHGLGCAILVGVSRKGFLGRLTGVTVAAERLAGSLAAELQALSQGVQVLRVHDVAAAAQARAVWCAIHQV